MPYIPPFLSNIAQIVNFSLGSDISTTSTTFGDMISQTISTMGGTNLLVFATFSCGFTSNGSATNRFRILFDGVEQIQAGNQQTPSPDTGAMVCRIANITSGEHIIELQWRISAAGAGTLYCRPVALPAPEHATLVVLEVLV
jgi:hypothetical protein